MQELHARVEAEHRRDDREVEVLRDRALRLRPDDVRGAQHRDAYVGAPAREPAHVGLDLEGVLGVARAGLPLGVHVLGEHRRVAAAGAVHRRRRLDHHVPQAGGLLAGSEQLHGADDVELLHRRATPGTAGGGDHAHVDDGVDVLLDDDLGDHRVADVGADEGHLADVTARWDDVHTDDAVHGRVVRGYPREAPPEVTRDPGDEHHPAHGRDGLLAELASLHARLLEQLAVLLLRHTLATLLDDRTHGSPFQC